MRTRVLSGMRPTGSMHLGHYLGALKNWVRLQDEHECFFFVADWHALTTHYEEREVIGQSVYDMVKKFVDLFGQRGRKVCSEVCEQVDPLGLHPLQGGQRDLHHRPMPQGG